MPNRHSGRAFSAHYGNGIAYTYGDSQWGDLLTAFNGNTITYDAIGNPLQYYNGNVFTWKQGRRLDTVSRNGSVVASYNYDENGIRTSKTINGVEHKFILNGSQIVAELWGNQIVIYLYDEIGSPVGMVYRNSNMAAGVYETYFFEKNMFGDILAVYNTSGVKQVSYTYDAFGKCTTTTHVSSNALINSLRYRGYYYDSETGFYYLNSRYYDPVTCRFINADGYVSTGQGLIGYNMFAYCGNNPVNMCDPNGEFGVLTSLAIIGICSLVSGAMGAFNAACTGGDVVEGAVEGFVTGAIGSTLGLFCSPGAAFALAFAGGSAVDVAVQLISQYDENKSIDVFALDYSRAIKVGLQTGIGAAIPAVGDSGRCDAIYTSIIWCEASTVISCFDAIISNCISSKNDNSKNLEEISWSIP